MTPRSAKKPKEILDSVQHYPGFDIEIFHYEGREGHAFGRTVLQKERDMPDDNRITSLRRNMQQIVHCAVEALSAHENNEDPRHYRDDLEHARDLIIHVLKTVKPMADGAARATGDKPR